MKTTPCLYITSEGIKVNNFPVEPELPAPIYRGVKSEQLIRDYQSALSEAKQKAILVGDQEKALILR